MTAKEWQQRPLESIYAVVFMYAIHYYVRSGGRIVKKQYTYDYTIGPVLFFESLVRFLLTGA